MSTTPPSDSRSSSMSFSSDPPYTSRQPESQQDWQSTRVQTQYSPRVDPLDGSGSSDDDHDIGRAMGDGTRELFVACEPADALVQQFDHLQPEFIAVHDLGVSASHKFLAGVAAAGQRTLQRLVIRRNGAGTVLATLQFVDCLAANGQGVRLYSTEVDGDTRTRQAVARVLLGRSRLGIAMVGDLPAHGLQAALLPWREASLQPGWLCRRMLFMPLVLSGALPTELARFKAATVIDVSLMPQVTKPADVWSQLCSAWNTLQRQGKPGRAIESLPLLGGPSAVRAAAALETVPGRLMPVRAEPSSQAGGLSPPSGFSAAGPGTMASRPAALPSRPAVFPSALPTALPPDSMLATSQPVDLAPLPPVWPARPGAFVPSGSPATAVRTTPGALPASTAAVPLPPTPMPVIGVRGPLNDEPLERYLSDIAQIAGVVSVCTFDTMSGRPVGHAGARPGPEELSRHGSSVLVSMMSASRGLGLGAVVPEATITLGQHHLLLRPLPAHPGMAVHVVLDKLHVTLALVQMQLRRIDEALIIAARITPPADGPISRR